MNKGILNRITALVLSVLLLLQCMPSSAYGQEIRVRGNKQTTVTDDAEAIIDDSVVIDDADVIIDDIVAIDDEIDNVTAGDNGTAEISISENGIPGTISGNYIYTADTNIKGAPVTIHYAVTDEDDIPFYEGTQALTVRDDMSFEWPFSFDRLSYKRTYKVKVYCESDRIAKEFGYKEVLTSPKHEEVNPFTAHPSSIDGKLHFQLKFETAIEGKTDVYFWIRTATQKKYIPYEKKNITSKTTTVDIDLSGEAYNGMLTYFDVNINGDSVSSSAEIEPKSGSDVYKVKLTNQIDSKDAIGYYDCFYSVEITKKSIRNDHVVNAYYYKIDDEPNRGHSFPTLTLNAKNEYKGVMGNGQNVKFDPDTEYYVEFEIMSSRKCVYRTIRSFKTDAFVEHSGKIVTEPAIDSAVITLSVPSGLEVPNKYYTHKRTAYIYVAKKDEDYPSSPATRAELEYFDGSFVAENILIDKLEEDTEYKLQAVFEGDGLIIASTQFKTLKEPREIVIEGTKILYGGFTVDMTVHNPDGSIVQADDLYATYRIKGDKVWQNLKKPELVDKKKKLYRFSTPVDMQTYGPGTVVEYKACFSNRSLYAIDVGIVTGEVVVPEDDRDIKVYSEHTYIDAHAINIGMTGMESYASYIVLMAKVNGGAYERNSVWSLRDGSNRDMKVCVYTDRYQPGDEVEYMLGYVDSREDTRNPAKLYNVKSGSFTVLPDNRGVSIFDATASTDSVTLRGKITGDGRMMDYDYVKIFYKVKGEAIPYESKVVTVLPEQMTFDVELTGLEDNSPYEYVIGVAKGSNAYIGELLNPYNGTISTQSADSRILLKVSDVQPLNVVAGYNVAGNTIEILYSDVARNANKLAITTVNNMKHVKYSSTDKNVVTINQKGVMTIKGPGIAAITAKKGKLKGQYTIKVIDYRPLLADKKITVVQGTSDIHNRLELVEQNGSVITDYEIIGATGGTLTLVKDGPNFEINASGYQESKQEYVRLILKSTKTNSVSGNSARSGDDTKTDIYDLDVFVDVKSPGKGYFEIEQYRVPNLFYCGESADHATFRFKSSKFKIEEIRAKSSKELFQVKEYDKEKNKLYLTPEALTAASLKKYINEEGDEIKAYYREFVPVTFVVKCYGYDEFEIKQSVEVEFFRPEIRIDEAVIPASDKEAIVSIYKGKEQLDAAKMRLRFDTGSYDKESTTKTTLATYYDQVRVRISNDLSGAYYFNVSSYQWTDKVKASGHVTILLDTELDKLQTKTREKTVIVNTSDGYNTSANFRVYVVGNERLRAKITPIVKDDRLSIVPTRNQGEFMVKGAKNASGTLNVTLDASYKNSAIKGTTIKIKLVNKQPDVRLKKVGKLNIANRNGSSVVLEPKILNVSSDVSISANTLLTSTVNVDGEVLNDRCFKTEVEDGKIIVKAKSGYKMYPNKDYTLSMKIGLSNGIVLKRDVVIRPVNKLPKAKFITVNKNMYKTNRDVLGEYILELPDGYEISGISVAKPNKSSIYHEEIEASYNSETGKVYLQFKKYGARLSSKKNYNIKCDLMIKGSDGIKNASVKLPVYIR